MVNESISTVLNELATKHIPAGMHKELYIDSRAVWIRMVKTLLVKKAIPFKYEVLLKFARSWEALLYQKQSILN
jgi:hypothetical protein